MQIDDLGKKRYEDYADTVGDGSGLKTAVGDYLTTPTHFKVTPADGEILVINRMIVTLLYTGTRDGQKYGNLTKLANGIIISVRDSDDQVIQYLTDSTEPVKQNVDWKAQCFDNTDYPITGSKISDNYRWTFTKNQQGLLIDGREGQYFSIFFQDSMATILEQKFKIEGIYANVPYTDI